MTWPWWRAFVAGLAVGLLLSAGSVGGAGWYYSEQLNDRGLTSVASPKVFDLVVVDINDASVTLERTSATPAESAWRDPGIWGLEWVGGYAQLSGIESTAGDRVIRQVEVLQGDLTPGLAVRIDSFAFPDDPQRAYGMDYEDVAIEGPLGPLPSWFVDAPGDGWAILVHGRNSSVAEMLRALRPVHDAGLKALVISYRNDDGAPEEPDLDVHYGATEWEDLEAAVRYALDREAGEVFLVGNSMGGSIVMSFLYRSPLAARITAVVLDAPMLDFTATVKFQAPDAVPGFIIQSGRWVAMQRFGLDWDELNYLARTDELNVPMLLFHGDDDRTVPVATSDQLAEARPDLVNYVRLPGVGHARAWNSDPATYEAAVRGFLGGPAR